VKVFRAETLHEPDFDEIVSLLQNGGVIAFPTDTAYGLGADPFNLAAIERIFTIKGRPDSKPVLLLVDSLAMAHSVIERNDMFDRVAAKFWPGSLTLVAHAVASLPAAVTAGTRTIGLRWPIAATATHLMSRFARPITATSANRSGMETPITAAEVRDQIGDSIDVLIDGGTLPARAGSTILDLTADPPVLIREGPVAFESLVEFFGGKIRRRVA
jgi:L-threonylcarbamoyladenylate synthase